MSSKLIYISEIDKIPEGETRTFDTDDVSVIIANIENNFYAIENVCSHDDAPLDDGELHGCEIECPRHGARFDVRNGEVTEPPAVVPVESFPVHIQSNKLYIEFEE